MTNLCWCGDDHPASDPRRVHGPSRSAIEQELEQACAERDALAAKNERLTADLLALGRRMPSDNREALHVLYAYEAGLSDAASSDTDGSTDADLADRLDPDCEVPASVGAERLNDLRAAARILRGDR